jgi:hypothetical protein
MNIKKNGYYISEPFHWVDMHASIKFEGENFYILKFEEDKCYFDSINDKKNIDINMLKEKENYGIYRTLGNVLEIIYNPNSEFKVKKIFTILSPDVLLDENLKEYIFIES